MSTQQSLPTKISAQKSILTKISFMLIKTYAQVSRSEKPNCNRFHEKIYSCCVYFQYKFHEQDQFHEIKFNAQA